MFRARRLLLKLLWIADLLAGPLYKAYLFVFKGVDISLLADVRLRQFANLTFGRNIIIEKYCMLDAAGTSRITLGDNVILQRGAQLLNYAGEGISIGRDTTIGRNSILFGHGGLDMGEGCLVGPCCSFIPANHRFDDTALNIKQQGDTRKGIVVGNNVWFGAHAVVLDGISIGDNCIIGAGSVVTRAIPPNSVAVGAPVRVIKTRSEPPGRPATLPAGGSDPATPDDSPNSTTTIGDAD